MTCTSGRLAAILVVTLVAYGAVPSAQQAAPGQAGSSGPTSYLNLQPRRRMPQPALLGAARTAQPADASEQGKAQAPGRRVVCGTTILSGDVAVDPGIQLKPMARLTQSTIRAVEPPICWEPSPRS